MKKIYLVILILMNFLFVNKALSQSEQPIRGLTSLSDTYFEFFKTQTRLTQHIIQNNDPEQICICGAQRGYGFFTVTTADGIPPEALRASVIQLAMLVPAYNRMPCKGNYSQVFTNGGVDAYLKYDPMCTEMAEKSFALVDKNSYLKLKKRKFIP
jgi:hypothetical protein